MARPRVPEHIETLKPYPPGKPIDEVKRELGLTRVIKLASNENPFGLSPKVREALKSALDDLTRYPDGSGFYLKKALSAALGQPAGRIVLGCGTNEIIDLTVRTFVGPGGLAVLPHPTFLVYQKFLQAAGAKAKLVPLKDYRIDLPAMAAAVTDQVRLVVVCNPNNPTGLALPKAELDDFLKSLPQQVVALVDEAYIDFVRDEHVGSSLDLVEALPNLIVTRTFSKLYGLAGLRLGYGVMNETLADYLNRVRQPFNVTSLALLAAETAVSDRAYLEKVKAETWAGIDFLSSGLKGLGLTVFPSQTNFILFRVPVPAAEVFQRMLRRGVIIRHMAAFGYDDCLRVSVGTAEENRVFLQELADVLDELGGAPGA